LGFVHGILGFSVADIFSDQVREIRALCDRVHIDPEELGARAAIAPETMRKYAKGYQRASDLVMQALRNVTELSAMRDAALSQQDNRRAPNAPYRLMESDTLMRHFSDLSRRLGQVSPTERKHVLGNIRDVVDELEAREIAPPRLAEPIVSGVSSDVASIAVKSQAAASALARSPDPELPPSHPTGEPISYRRAKARGSRKRSKHQPAPRGQAPT
jgi:hypothetical protein